MKKILKKWMIFVEYFGNFQMALFMSLIYFIFIPFYYIKIHFDDPLISKSPKKSNWKKVETNFVDNLEEQG